MIIIQDRKTGPARRKSNFSGILTLLGKRQQGQVAIILILLAAFALLFFAVVMNFSSVAKEKNKTMMAAEQASSTMGSMMSSYAERLSMEYLGGSLIKCKKSNFWAAVWKMIYIVLICVLMWGPAGIWFAMIFVIPQSITAAKTLSAESEMIKQWNQQMSNMSAEDQVLEQGINAALRTVLDDPVTIADFLDNNSNGQYVTYTTDPDHDHVKTAVNGETGWDEVSRQNYFYTLRLQSLEAGESDAVDEFADALHDFIFRDDPSSPPAAFSVNSGDFGLHDPTKETCDSSGPAECDPYCVPEAASCCFVDDCQYDERCDGDPTVVSSGELDCCNPCPDDLSCWGMDDASAGNASSCGARSFLGSDYPFVFRPFYENPNNNETDLSTEGIVSWREFFGRDDEVEDHTVNASGSWDSNIENLPQVSFTPTDIDGDSTISLFERFRERDSTGFFDEDLRQNILSFSSAEQASVFAFFHLIANDFPAEDPGAEPSGHQRISDDINASYLASDSTFLLPDNACGISMGDVDHRTLPDAGWKPGADLFCDDEYPYDTECPKHGNGTRCTQEIDVDGDGTMESIDRDCLCGEIDGQEKNFNEDKLDAMYYEITDLFEVASQIETLFLSDPTQYAISFSVWYDQIADWIEEGCRIGGTLTDVGADEDLTVEDCDESLTGGPVRTFTGKGRDGKLREWRDYLRHFYDKIDNYETDVTSVAGACAPVGTASASYVPWCIPPETDCHNAPLEEAFTFNYNGDASLGDIEDVLSCLKWNAQDTLYDSVGEYIGNGEKFEHCYDLCLEQANADPLAEGGPEKTDGTKLTLQDTIDLYRICGKIPRPLMIDDSTGYEPPAGFNLAGNNVDNEVNAILECLAANSLGTVYFKCRNEPWNTGEPWDTVSVEVPPEPSTVGLPASGFVLLQEKVDYIQQQIVPECETGTSTRVFTGICNGNYGSPEDVSDPMSLPDDAIRCESSTWQKDVSTCIASWVNDAVAWPFIRSFMEDHFGSVVTVPMDKDENPVTVYEDLMALIPEDFVYSDSCKGEGTFNTPTQDSEEFLDFLSGNIDPAKVQVDIFERRIEELTDVIGKMTYAKNVLQDGHDRFTEFLDNGTAFDVGPESTDYEGAPIDPLASRGYLEPGMSREIDLVSNDVVEVGEDLYSVYEATTVDAVHGTIEFATDSPAELLIKHRQDVEDDGSSGYPSVLVYYWTTYDEDTLEKISHAAKIEVRAPLRCVDNSCVDTGADRFPWIRAYHTGGFFSKKVCNVLEDYQGRVKARVIRYDEKEPAPSFGLANKIPFVGRSLYHPDMGEASGGTVFGPCEDFADKTLEGFYKNRTDGTSNNWKAIMLNYPPGQHPDPLHVFNDPSTSYDECWEHIHENYLKYGIHSESCARYYWGTTGVTPRTRAVGMQIRFVPCDQSFLDGNT